MGCCGICINVMCYVTNPPCITHAINPLSVKFHSIEVAIGTFFDLYVPFCWELALET